MAAVYNLKKEKTGEIDLPEGIFSVKWNPDLVRQALVAQMANRRKPLAHAKDRSEVRGGGRKPWRQKGTGRARHGSTRSPLWAGGGVTFGPSNEKKFAKKINKKMKRLALLSLLSKKMADGEITVIDVFKLENHKTKALAGAIGLFHPGYSSVLLVPAEKEKNIFLACRNIPKVKALNAGNLNVYDVLASQYIIMDREAVNNI